MTELSNIHWHEFNTAQELAVSLADQVSTLLAEAIHSRGQATLLVSGGTTPSHFFEELSQKNIEWSSVFITLVDERLVPQNSPRLNASLVQKKLIQNKASEAVFLPLFLEPLKAEEAAQKAEETLKKISLPPDVTILGMGKDGHTASFFPDSTELNQLLDPFCKTLVSAVHAPSAGEDRLTLTLPVLASSRFLALHIEGRDKKDILKNALSFAVSLPVRRLINEAFGSVHIFWAPESSSPLETKTMIDVKAR